MNNLFSLFLPAAALWCACMQPRLRWRFVLRAASAGACGTAGYQWWLNALALWCPRETTAGGLCMASCWVTLPCKGNSHSSSNPHPCCGDVHPVKDILLLVTSLTPVVSSTRWTSSFLHLVCSKTRSNGQFYSTSSTPYNTCMYCSHALPIRGGKQRHGGKMWACCCCKHLPSYNRDGLLLSCCVSALGSNGHLICAPAFERRWRAAPAARRRECVRSVAFSYCSFCPFFLFLSFFKMFSFHTCTFNMCRLATSCQQHSRVHFHRLRVGDIIS